MTELLLSCDDIEVNVRDYSGQTPLMLAARDGHYAVIELLVSHSSVVDAHIKSHDGSTALMYAAEAGHEQIVKHLLSYKGTDVNAKDKQIVEHLLSYKGTDVNAKDIASNTSLYSAVALGHEKVVKLLLAHSEIDLGIEDGGAQDAFYQVERLAKAAFNKPRLRRERKISIGWTEQRETVCQTSLKLLHVAIEQRSEMT